MKRKQKPRPKTRKQPRRKLSVSLPAEQVEFCQERGSGRVSTNLAEIVDENKEFRRWAETR